MASSLCWLSRQTESVRPSVQPPVCPLITSLYRWTHLLTSSALPRKPMASQEVTSERCVVMLHCCACAIVCTRRETGSSLSDTSLTQLSVCAVSPVHLSLSQPIRGNGPLHHAGRPSEISHEVEEVQVGGRSCCSAARCPGLTLGHMSTLPACWDVSGAVAVSQRRHLSASELLTSRPEMLTSAHLPVVPCWQPAGSAHMVATVG